MQFLLTFGQAIAAIAAQSQVGSQPWWYRIFSQRGYSSGAKQYTTDVNTHTHAKSKQNSRNHL